MDLSIEEIEMLNFFCFRLLKECSDETSDMSYIKFIFNDSDYDKIIMYLEKIKSRGQAFTINIKTNFSNRFVSFGEIERVIELVKKSKDDYIDNYNENINYIRITDLKEFLQLLNEIVRKFDENARFNNFNATALLRSIWLRMGTNDINNVNNFLKRQLEFIKNDYLFSTNETTFKEINGICISYLNHGNEDWFETNRHIKVFLKREVGKTFSQFLGTTIKYEYYTLPVIHCAFIKENNEASCYVYGIQNLKNTKKDEVINALIHDEKKRLRNKNVSPDFIIALKIFIDLLKEKGITTIKVPLLQVFNYDFHQSLGEKYHRKMASYSPEQIKDLEWLNATDYAIEEYENTKRQYARYYNKEDIISSNKTERLINTFYLVSEMYDNIDIVTESFIEEDNIICKIKYQKEKARSH